MGPTVPEICKESGGYENKMILMFLTQDVRTGDKAVHRDKEMRKIEKCSRSVRWTI